MRKRSKPRCTQFELFEPPRQRPNLSQEIRQKLIRLVARMMRQYARKGYPDGRSREAGDE